MRSLALRALLIVLLATSAAVALTRPTRPMVMAAAAEAARAGAPGGDSLIALSGARTDPRFSDPVDLVIETPEQWAAHRAAFDEDSRLFEGMVIGVAPGALRPDETIARGGPDAEAADAALAKATSVHDPARDPVPPCARDLGEPLLAGSYGAYFACSGIEPDTYFVPLAIPNDTNIAQASLEERIAAALDALTSQPDPAQRAAGYYSTISGGDRLVRELSVADGTLSVDLALDPSRARIGSLIASTTFLDQVLRTALSFDAVKRVRPTLGGDCEAFWIALDSGGCHTLTRDALQERE